MNKEELANLAEKFIADQATIEEKNTLHHHYDSNSVEGEEIVGIPTDETEAAIKRRIYQQIEYKVSKQNKPEKEFNYWFKLTAAAIVLVALGLSFYYFAINKKFLQPTQVAQANGSIAPGTNKAILTLSNGATISLSDVPDGKLISKNGISITKTADGQLLYSVVDQTTSAKLPDTYQTEYNTISTPRGGKYQINLPDGTRVWLNAASSLTFPLSFNGVSNRKVVLNGEAYFEVAPNKKQPFHVVTSKQTVEVLGTHFNVNSYEDEEVTKTTLIEGAVRINRNRAVEFAVLKPGQQSVLQAEKFIVNEVDTDEAISWKNGYFLFNKEPMPSAMRKLARWYNVDIVYANNVDDITFEGTFSCAKTLEQTLKILEYTGSFKFKIEGRRLTVML